MVTSHRDVALYGGSFDPPHNGHVLLATWTLCRASVDALWLLPAAGHAFGKTLTPFATRVAMLEQAFGHLGPRVRVEPIEDSLPRPSYTVDTVRALTALHPEVRFSLVMGSDVFETRHSWKEWDALDAMLGGRVIVVGREGVDVTGVSPAVTLPGFSSTAVRNAAQAETPYWWMVPPAVEAHIREQGLYR